MEETNTSIEYLRRQARDPALLERALAYAREYIETVDERDVYPSAEALRGLDAFDEPLPDGPADPQETLDTLHRVGSPTTVAQTGGRYFGFVNGGLLPAALAARWLADAWDQNAALHVMSPVASVLERVCERWLVELLGLPDGTAAGFVTGTTIATLCGLAAGRDHLLRRAGWDVDVQGLFGAPALRVVLGDQAHSSVFKALSLLGLGKKHVTAVPTDRQGRIVPEEIPALDDRTLLLLQAGHVNTGAFDPFAPIGRRARETGAWVHVDGAFGLWAAASKQHASLTEGVHGADSWSTDAHKTLNAPYDSGVVFCRDREALTRALHTTGSYLAFSEDRDGMRYTPDMSRRARSVELWATLKALGRKGVAALVDNLCDKAAYFARELAKKGFTIENDVCFNQVLVSCASPALTSTTLEHIQASGTCWCGGATWEGKPVIRISVCSFMTTREDIDRSVQAFVEARTLARGG